MMNWKRSLGVAILAIFVTADLAPAQFRRRGSARRTGVAHKARRGQWSRQSTIKGPNGRQATVQASGSHGNGQFSRDKTITGPNGKAATVDTNGTYGNGQFTRDKTITGPDGKTTTVETTGTHSNDQNQKQ